MCAEPFLNQRSSRILGGKCSEKELCYVLMIGIFQMIQRIHNFKFSKDSVPQKFHLLYWKLCPRLGITKSRYSFIYFNAIHIYVCANIK